MAIKEKIHIEHIQSGRIDFYLPLTFETNLSYSDMGTKVAECISGIIQDHLDGIEESIRSSLSDVSEQFHIKPKVNNEKKSDLRRKQEATAENHNGKIIGDSASIEVLPTDHGIAIRMHPEETVIYNLRRQELLNEQGLYEKYYGATFTGLQDRFVLLPLCVQLYNGKKVWINSILYIFLNKMGILKIELPLIDVSSQPLMEYDHNGYLGNVDDQWGMHFNGKDTTVEDVSIAFIDKIEGACGITVKLHIEGLMRNIILVRFDGMPKQIDNIPDDIQEELYRIVAAPVMTIECASIKKEAKEYMSKQLWRKYNFAYITKTTGGCLSIIDDAFQSWAQDKYCEDNNKTSIDAESQSEIDRFLIRNVHENVEFALVIPILKHLNASYVLKTDPTKARWAQMAYNENVLLISRLQDCCYGSVSEQVKVFEQMMPFYLKEELMKKRKDAFDTIIAEKEAQRNNSFQTFMSIASIVVALLFGLPAVYDTFSITRKSLSFFSQDIPCLTVENTSLFAWIFIMAMLCAYMCRKYKKK